ncbi:MULTISPECIES: hypothetical protein [unclassified Caulobacter]|uniref:hypothetical protein n=1 Tax=unclassified Caulobacter TaxID=2648921 RepID=UPI0006F8FB71|nr:MULTISPECIES: hypothetical protein [unclassified Caulobacter]KQV57004.1 hypothetical protein ASC62_12010 [Caulobacter sp. Root342]KQV66490.1 hypothetical protein ASC70_11660 [Caulobacter sp. Root343]
MQVSSAITPNATAQTGSPLVDQVKRQAAILADDSGATNDQKVEAYIAISKAMAQSASAGSGWFQQSTQADRDAVNAVLDGSDVAKQIRQAADDFNARGMRGGRNGNVMADQLGYLNGLPATQQKMIFAGTASLDQTASLDGWKAFLQQNVEARDQQLAAEAPKRSAVKVTLTDEAKAVMARSKDGAEPSASGDPGATVTLTLGRNDEGGVAEAALKMLQSAADRRLEAEERADAKEKAKTALGQTTDVYEAGQAIDALI